MRRILGSLLILTLPALAGPNDPVIDCPATVSAPRVDGNPQDPAWRDVPPRPMSGVDHVHPRFRDNWTGDDDLSATFRVVRCGEDLYLLFEVRDDHTVHEASRSWWVGDSIEVFLRTDLASGDAGESYTNDDYQIILMPFYAPQRWGVCQRGPEVPYSHGGLRGLEVAHTVVPGGYVLEARIPLWQFRVRPDADGLIGFDVALNDVDDPAATEQQSYLTLSGRFDLFAVPRNFARLRIGPWPPPSPAPLPLKARFADWLGVAMGLVAVVLLALLARRIVRAISKRTRVGAASAAAGFLLAAGLCALAPRLAAAIDARAAKKTWAGEVEEASAIARTCLDLDRSPEAEARAEHLVALLRDGQAAIRPAYEYRTVPTRADALRGPPSADAPGPTHFGVSVPAGERRAFPLPGVLAPARIRLDLSLPLVDERAPAGSPAVEAHLDLASGASLVATTELAPHPHLFFDLSEHKGAPLRVLVVRSRLPSQPLLVDALYAEGERGTWSALPLCHVAQAGVPLDVWQDRPLSRILPVPRGGTAVIALPDGLLGDRIWLALRAPGADPTLAGGTDAVSFRVRYTDGQPGPEVHLGGRDLAGADPDAVGPMDIALRWEDAGRQPLVYTLHAADLDPSRAVAAVEVKDLGTLPSLSVAALTLGRQVSPTPPAASGLRLEGTRLFLREEERARLRSLGFSVRSPRGLTRTTGSAGEVPVPLDLAFGQGETGAIEVLLPGTPWLQAIARRDAAFAGGAALLLAFAGVIAGASILGKARRLRVKMLVALTAASVVPLVFLVVSLTRILDLAAEEELRGATLGALTSASDRISAAKAKARDLAFNAARDLLSPAYAADPEAFERRALFNREKIEAQGAFLRLPELDAHRPTRLGRAAFFDTLSGPGLYWTPWDGLVAIGFARTADQRRCVVGLPAARLVADVPPGTTVVLSSPAGETLASTGPVPDQLLGPSGRERGRALFEETLRLGRPVYEPRAAAGGEPVAAAHALVLEGSTPLALLGVYRPRAATDEVKASTLRTLLVSTLAALLLVAIVGGTLVDRVTQRLQRVTRAARAIAAGDLGTRAPVEEEDEVGRLALSFNTMADALDDRVRQLTELQRGLHELTAALDRTEVARAACSLLARATGAASVQLAVLDATGEGLEPLHRRGDGDGRPL
ncbi:MAG TPA: sugar-binding protein, partial [Planctomycetota bacterium]|nr:sugar-binding protein [Planctomycetota bacterium]